MTKTTNPNELTIDNSALMLIDHQPAVALCAPALMTESTRVSSTTGRGG